jgi:uncharacterized protein YaeQ
MMLRVLALVQFTDERLEFGHGLSVEDEPDRVLRDDTGVIGRRLRAMGAIRPEPGIEAETATRCCSQPGSVKTRIRPDEMPR